jgi:DNA repair protein RadC
MGGQFFGSPRAPTFLERVRAQVSSSSADYDHGCSVLPDYPPTWARDQEVFAIILLDVKRRLIEYVELFQGCVDSASIYPREVVKWVIATRAFEVVIAHNHPSGDPEPSQADRMVTARLRQALSLIDVKLMDHLIVGKSITSMSARGILA